MTNLGKQKTLARSSITDKPVEDKYLGRSSECNVVFGLVENRFKIVLAQDLASGFSE